MCVCVCEREREGEEIKRIFRKIYRVCVGEYLLGHFLLNKVDYVGLSVLESYEVYGHP